MGATAAAALTALVAATLAGFQEPAGADDRLYGRVVTAQGDVLEGFLRWDRNEGSWVDVLDGSKELSAEDAAEVDRLRRELGATGREGVAGSLVYGDVLITWDVDDEPGELAATSGIRFGHVRSLRPLDARSALLTLTSGEEVRLTGGSTDLGSGFRGLVVEDGERGVVDLGWSDLGVVELMTAPAGAVPAAGRLHGTVVDRRGDAFTGYVAWNVRDIYTTDVLTGRARGAVRRIPFGSVAAVERAGSRAAVVTTTDGERVRLEGSSDVDSRNGGIDVSDPGLGMVRVSWGELESVRFHPPATAQAAAAARGAFDGGRALRGTVDTEEGESHAGWIRWDDDEADTWELLDGELRGVTYKIELGRVASVRKLSARGALVTLLDGRSFELERSNDVDRRNRGVVVRRDDGSALLVPWYDFLEVRFEHGDGTADGTAGPVGR